MAPPIPLLSILTEKDIPNSSDISSLRARLSNFKELTEIVKEFTKGCYTFFVDESIGPQLKVRKVKKNVQ